MARRLLATAVAPVTEERRAEVLVQLTRDSGVTRDFVLLTIVSCIVATLGLEVNSAAVIIGAMLIAAFVPVLLALALAIVQTDLRLALRALASFVIGAGLAVGLSALLDGLGGHWSVTLLEDLPTEILARTRPTSLDLAIAMAGGAAAAYTLAHPRLSAALPGVAIATALMPPLCVIGIGWSLGRGDIALGASLLLQANFVAIVFGGLVVFGLLGFRPPLRQRDLRGVLAAALLAGAFLLPVGVPLVIFLDRIQDDLHQTALIENVIRAHLATIGDSSLVGVDRQDAGERVSLVVQIRSARSLTHDEAVAIQVDIAQALQRPTAVRYLVIPMTRLDTVSAPPTRGPGGTSTPSPRPSATVAPTLSPRPEPTLAPAPTPGASPGPSYAVVAGTSGSGVNVRRAPGRTTVIAALPDGTIVEVLGGRAVADGVPWTQVLVPNGSVGWIAADYLVPYEPYRAPAINAP